MPTTDHRRLAARRHLLGLTQAELAVRAGLPRSSVSAIEAGRLRPSVDAALAVSKALGCAVEDLFGSTDQTRGTPAWAWTPAVARPRYWVATVAGRSLRYPLEHGPGLIAPLDGSDDAAPAQAPEPPTLVLAGCDPAAGLLAAEYHAVAGQRLLAFSRSGAAALELLAQGVVHAAALHRATTADPERNARTVRERLGPGYRLLRLCDWQAGVALAPARRPATFGSGFQRVRRWAIREAGSAARECLEGLLGRPAPRQRAWPGHREVAMAVRAGFAEAGVCIQLCAEEAGLPFAPVRTESLDLCFPAALERDPAVAAMIRLVRSANWRRLLDALPGYDAAASGALVDA